MSRVLLDTDIYSEVIKAINPTVTQNAIAYRQANGVLTLSVVTVGEIKGVRTHWRNQRGQDSLMVFSSGNSGERTGGRPRFRRVEAKPSRAAVCCIHSSDPCGLPL